MSRRTYADGVIEGRREVANYGEQKYKYGLRDGRKGLAQEICELLGIRDLQHAFDALEDRVRSLEERS